MTALDRAFIKAFDRHCHVGSRSIPRGATVALSEAIRESAPTAEVAQEEHTRVHAPDLGEQSVVPSPHFRVAGPSRQQAPTAQSTFASVDTVGTVDEVEAAHSHDSPEAEPEEHAAPAASNMEAEPFRPMLQVERFPWPRVCHQLQAQAAESLEMLADALRVAGAQGKRVLGLGGCRRGEGATTIALAAARRLGQDGLRVALVDADFRNPQLAERLQLLPQSGWAETLDGSLPLEEAVIETADGQIALLPQIEPRPDLADHARQRLIDSLAVLRTHYDAVLVDLEPLGGAPDEQSPLAATVHRQLDAMVLIQHAGMTTAESLVRVQTRFRATGPAVIGVVQNFA